MKVPINQLVKEFKVFAFKGNMIDLAVAVIIGTAFGAVVNSLVKDIFMPAIRAIILLVTGSEATGAYQNEWTWYGIRMGAFVGEVVNFLLIATAVFIVIVKIVGALIKKATPPPAAGPVVKECALCCSEIPIKAVRCKFCTADLAKT